MYKTTFLHWHYFKFVFVVVLADYDVGLLIPVLKTVSPRLKHTKPFEFSHANGGNTLSR